MRYNPFKSYPIIIGKTREPFSRQYGDDAVYYMHYWGCTLCVAKSRYGKSAIMKHLAVIAANEAGRRVVIIDPEYKWCQSITKRNYRSRMPDSIKNFMVLENVSLQISDITEEQDWVYLGFTGIVAEKLAQLAVHTELHDNDPDSFLQILLEIPTRKDDIAAFNQKYKFDFVAPLFDASYKQMIDNFYNIKEFFYNHKKPGGRMRVEKWKELIHQHNLIINVQANKTFTSFIVGWIMDQIEPELQFIKPLFISEEASWLFGDPLKTGFTKSAQKAVTWTNRYAKRGIAMVFITQFPSDLHPDLLQSVTCIILGALNPPIVSDLNTIDRFFELSRKIVSDLERGIRPFWLIDTIKNRIFVFDPIEPCCDYWT